MLFMGFRLGVFGIWVRVLGHHNIGLSLTHPHRTGVRDSSFSSGGGPAWLPLCPSSSFALIAGPNQAGFWAGGHQEGGGEAAKDRSLVCQLATRFMRLGPPPPPLLLMTSHGTGRRSLLSPRLALLRRRLASRHGPARHRWSLSSALLLLLLLLLHRVSVPPLRAEKVLVDRD